MNDTPHHATTSDLPDWPTPPRVRDIPNTPNSWGWVHVSSTSGTGAVSQDEIGRLWVDGDAIPRFQRVNPTNGSPGAYVYWTEHGIGLYVHPKSYPYLGDISSLDMGPDRWIPVVTVAQEPPEFAKQR